jgi:hypothetical protein
MEFNAIYNDVSNNNGGIISIEEGTKELHGDWLLVTRRKKTTKISQPHTTKNATQNKTNRFSLLNHMAHQIKHNPSHNKTDPRPSPHEATRAHKNPDAKKRRHDSFNDDTIITSLSINPKQPSHGPTHKVYKIFKPILTPNKIMSNVTLHGPTTTSQTKNSMAPPQFNQPKISTTTQDINYKIATSHTSNIQTHEKNSDTNNQLSLDDLGDEAMTAQDNTETTQVIPTTIEGYQGTSSDCKEDIVT